MRKRDIIPIHIGRNASAGESGFGESNSGLFDCVVDVQGDQIVVTRRPCLKEFVDCGNANIVDGLFWWHAQQKAVFVCNGKGFTIDDYSGNFTELTGTFFAVGNRITFADFGTAIYGADKGVIKKMTTSAVTEMADADAPQQVSHVAFMDQYLLANEINTRKCHRSDVGAPDSWSSNWFSSESQYDNLRSIGVENLEVFLMGDRTCEVWEDTGADSPFSRLSGGYIPTGTVAPYSFVYCSKPINAWVWVDHNRSLVKQVGRDTQDLSIPINRYIQRDGTVLSDAIGDFINAVGHSFYALHLPTQDETLVFDFTSGLWLNWSYFNSVAGVYNRWRGNCHCVAPSWGKILVGDKANGKIYTLDADTYQDNGHAVRMLIRTNKIDRGDFGALKRTNSVTFRAKKVSGSYSGPITINYRYRDDGANWSNDASVVLSASAGPAGYIGIVNRLGRYKTREWEFWNDENLPVALLPPIEDYELTY